VRFSVRKTKTKSGKTAIQAVHYENRKVIVDKHFGSGGDEQTISNLLQQAKHWIDTQGVQPVLFPEPQKRSFQFETTRFTHTTYVRVYIILHAVVKLLAFQTLPSLLIDLAIIRLIEPASKLRSLELLERYFNISYTTATTYRTLPKLIQHKKEVENLAVAVATKTLEESLSLVLYDVTTLYFETHAEDDDLRKRGFSKDHKENQPQIVIGLLVTTSGFPVGYEVFHGKTFEGDTMLQVIKDFATKYAIPTPVVVADAAMISAKNVIALEQAGFQYIVGARLATSKQEIISQLEKAPRDTHLRIQTENTTLICAFSDKRYRKNKREFDKQITKAEEMIREGKKGRRIKFVQSTDEKLSFNEALKHKATVLLGWKGYHTNIPEEVSSSEEIVRHYQQLWQVEKSFRMTKSDLKARPIFLYTEDAIKSHILVCFLSLCIGKYMELVTKQSLRSIRDTLWGMADAHIIDIKTKEAFVLQSELSEGVKELLKKLRMSY